MKENSYENYINHTVSLSMEYSIGESLVRDCSLVYILLLLSTSCVSRWGGCEFSPSSLGPRPLSV